jgi:hypothetical protein
LVPNFKGLDEIIDINDTNVNIKFGTKIKMLNIEKIKLFFKNEKQSEADIKPQDLNFNDVHLNGPVTRAHAKLINFKKTVQLILFILKNKQESDIDANEIDIS